MLDDLFDEEEARDHVGPPPSGTCDGWEDEDIRTSMALEGCNNES